MRIIPILIAASVLALPASATKPTEVASEPALAGGPEAAVLVEDQTYRFGDLLRAEPGTSVEACAAACDGDARCAAWTLTPQTYSRTPSCELKSNPGAASYRPGAVSGLASALHHKAVPLDELVPSPAPRTFGDPLPKTAPELLGGPGTKISANVAPEAPQEQRAVLFLKAPAATLD